MSGGQDWASEQISTTGDDMSDKVSCRSSVSDKDNEGGMSEGLKKPAKLGDVIRTQLSVFSGGRILRVKLETQDSELSRCGALWLRPQGSAGNA